MITIKAETCYPVNTCWSKSCFMYRA